MSCETSDSSLPLWGLPNRPEKVDENGSSYAGQPEKPEAPSSMSSFATSNGCARAVNLRQH